MFRRSTAPLFLPACALVLGVALSPPGLRSSWAVACLAVVLLGLAVPRSRGRLIATLLGFLALGAARAGWESPGVDVVRDGDQLHLVVWEAPPTPRTRAVARIGTSQGWRRVEVSTDPGFAPRRGERLLVRGRLRPGWRGGLPLLQSRRGSVVSLSPERDRGFGPLERARVAVGRTLDRGARSPEGRDVLRALVLGESRALPPTVREAFSRTGTSHLLAISGLHVGLMAGVAGLALRTAVRRIVRQSVAPWALDGRLDLLVVPAAVAVAGAYVVLAGAPVSSRRAWWMLCAAGVALLWRRSPVGWNVAAVAAVALAWTDPASVVSVGAALSFTAVAGLLAASPTMDRLAAIGHRRLRPLIASVCVSVVALVATAPLVAATFGQIPLAGAWVNVLAVPAFGVVLVPALLGGALGLVSEAAGAAVCGLGAFGLEGVLVAIEWFADPVRSPVILWQPATAIVVGIYLGWGWLLVAGEDPT